MGSSVLITDRFEVEIAAILGAAEGRGRKIFVHMRRDDVQRHREALPGFRFVVFEETTSATNGWIQSDSMPDDLFVLYRTYPAKVPDRNLGTYQSRTKGLKLVIHDHPFCGKAAPWAVYFPFSYVDKSLLGFPHVYAAELAHGKKPLDPVDMARRVAPAASTTIKRVFGRPVVDRVSLTAEEHAAYAALRDQVLADNGMTPKRATRTLRRFVEGTTTVKAASSTGAPCLPVLDLNRVWPAWKSGARRVVISDTKVDDLLLAELQAYMAAANTFVRELSKSAA